MADRTVASLSTALQTTFAREVANQINRSVVVAQVLPNKPPDGKNITWTIKTGVATPTTAVIGDGVDVSNWNADAKHSAALEYGTYHDGFRITGKAMAQAAIAGRPEDLAQLLADEIGDGVTRLASVLGSAIYTGSAATDNMWGLYSSGGVFALGDTGTYAGVNRATYTQFQGNVVDALGADFQSVAFTRLRQLVRETYTASGMFPDVFLADPTQHEKYGLAFGAERRYVDEIRRNDGTSIKLDGGYKVLEFDGSVIIQDRQHPVQKVTALNTDYVCLRQLPDAFDTIRMAMGLTPVGGTFEAQYGNGKTGFTARIQPLAVNGDKFPFALYLYPQVQVKTPNTCGYITNLGA